MRRTVLLLLLALTGLTACSSKDANVAAGKDPDESSTSTAVVSGETSTTATSTTAESRPTTVASATSSTAKATTTSTTRRPTSSTTGNGASGIRGTVYAGPQCPVQRQGDSSCDDKPVPADVSIRRPAGDEAAHASAGGDGKFSAAVPAGRYTASATSPNAMSCQTQEVDVNMGAYTTITVRCDTGIR